MVHPRLHEAFVELSRYHDLLAEGTPLLKDKGLMLRSIQDMERPELISARRRLGNVLKRSSRDAILDSSREPVRMGKGRRRVARSQSKTDTYRIHPALGLYPAELDFIYPFTQVVAAEEIERRMGSKDAALLLLKLGYKSVKASQGRTAKNAWERLRNKRTRRGASPSPRSSSVRPRLPRRP